MLDGGVNQIARYFVLGVVGLLLTITFSELQNNIEETGDRYYRIPVIGNEFRGKRARQTAVIFIPLVGFILMAVLQPKLVKIALGDLRVLSSLCGLLISMILFSSSAEPEHWKINDGKPLTHYAVGASVLLIFGPWVGPWIAKITIRFLSRQYNRLISFLSTQISNILTFVTGWIGSHIFELLGILSLVIAFVYLAKREQDWSQYRPL